MASVIKKGITESGAIRLNWFNYLPHSFAPNVLDRNVTHLGIKLIMKHVPNVTATEIGNISRLNILETSLDDNNNRITNLRKPKLLSSILQYVICKMEV